MHGFLGLPIEYVSQNDRNFDFSLSETLYVIQLVTLFSHYRQKIFKNGLFRAPQMAYRSYITTFFWKNMYISFNNDLLARAISELGGEMQLKPHLGHPNLISPEIHTKMYRENSR